MPYKVYVTDNYAAMDDSGEYQLGIYETADEAVDAAKKVVDDPLISRYEKGMNANQLYKRFAMFGEVPNIVSLPPATENLSFCARQYARLRSKEICARK